MKRGKKLGRVYDPIMPFENMFNTGVSMADYKLTWIADMRNKLAHEAISMKPNLIHDEIISLEKIKWMYEIAKGLRIL